MRKNVFLVWSMFSVLAIIIGCSKAEFKTTSVLDNSKGGILTKSEYIALQVKKKGTYKISAEEAIKKLKDFSKQVDSKRDKQVNIKSCTLKKNANNKDLYYEVIFDSNNGQGYSLVSVDERIPEVFCFVEEGNLKDTTYNNGLRFFLRALSSYVDAMTNEEMNIDSLCSVANSKKQINQALVTKSVPPFDPEVWTYVDTYTSVDVSERLKPLSVNWSQEPPYNNNLPFISGISTSNGRAYAGCTIIATAQVMSYHKKAYQNITSSMWDDMIQDSTNSNVASLIESIYYSLDASSNKKGTSARVPHIIPFLNSNGFVVNTDINYSYNFDVLWDALYYGPTIIGGMPAFIPLLEGGHAWVADGINTTHSESYELYTYEYNGHLSEYLNPIYSYTFKTVRYNWGWGPFSSNGWFSSGVLDPGNGSNYNYWVQIIRSII